MYVLSKPGVPNDRDIEMDIEMMGSREERIHTTQEECECMRI